MTNPQQTLSSMVKNRKWFFEMESPPGEDALATVEVTTKDLKYCISLVDKAAEGFERIDSNSERSSTVNKMLSNSIACHQEITCERKSQTSLLSYVKKLP